ncbi:N-formylglutamate amidohydrolase [Francisella sp. SYW-9]|uniref:N-formylglutamate amidohydrolase n=1 Tax=Francisella sp. SYW-9 TaxID=2610888 RepID=UPI00123D6EEA|nr:N-formylglutamate amidohydrolase [Francisella sp. SYW-9]
MSYTIHKPFCEEIPLLFDSPHSGFIFPLEFKTCASIDALKSGCDWYVDLLWQESLKYGATILAASFPRAFIDPNRAVTDIDLDLIDGEWTREINITDYSKRGMGLIRRYALPNQPMYICKLSVDEVAGRIDKYYLPYRNTLADLLQEKKAKFGRVYHVDCHSMKSKGNKMNIDAGAPRPDFVISDAEGTTSEKEFVKLCIDTLESQGYSVSYNNPYKGGDIVRSCGNPDVNIHSVQIEINRALYLDETRYVKKEGFIDLQINLGILSRKLSDYVKTKLANN